MEMKISCFLKFLNSSMSLGRSRVYPTKSATYPALPLQKSRIEALEGWGTPSRTISRCHSKTLGLQSSTALDPISSTVFLFCYWQVVRATLVALQGCTSCTSPSFMTPFPCLFSLFLFFSLWSPREIGLLTRRGRGVGGLLEGLGPEGVIPADDWSSNIRLKGSFLITMSSGMSGAS